MTDSPSGPLTYREAGVDIDAGEALVDAIRGDVAATQRPEVIGGLGGFGGLFAIDPGRWREPVLVAGTDGVGTKLRLAGTLERHEHIGIDLVAMCVNDVIVTGAEPLFFLDYFATGRLDVDRAATVIRGIAAGCRQAGCALIGGETAEMPGMYAAGDYDIAGFCVGAAERDAMPVSASVTPGDRLIGLASSGPHSNGYSLIRRVLEQAGTDPATACGKVTLADALMAPTRIYVDGVRALFDNVGVRGLAHITGGGLIENLPRALPAGTLARIDARCWQRPPVFEWLQRAGGIEPAEMLRTFNCGIGMVAIVPPEQADAARSALAQAGEVAYDIGVVEPSQEAEPRARVEHWA